MKKATTYILLFLLVFMSSMTPKKPIKNKLDPKKETEILETVLSIIKSRHIVSKRFDDDFSKKMFKTYLDTLDVNKLFLLQSDIEEFKKYETQLDDHLKTNDLTFFFMTYDRIKIRMAEAKEIYTNILKNKLDFTKSIDSEYTTSMAASDANKLKFCKNKQELEKKWESLLKTLVLNRVKTKILSNKNLLEYPEKIKELVEKESGSIGSLVNGSVFDFDRTSREYIFQHFINSILFQFDNYSKYYNPVSRNDYLFKLTGTVEGVGISLQFDDNYSKIVKLEEGGPAMKSKKFEIGDLILKVTQDKETPVNVVGFSPFEVSKLLKGPIGTLVKITVKKPNGIIQEISLKRGLVAKNDTFLKSCVIKKNKVTYGLISFPRFYNDVDDELARNTVDDFATELQILKREGAKGLILDMRNNKGGDLENAVKIVGNFVTKNPIAQFKSREQNLTTLESENLKRNWDRNIIIIVNKKTSSEAEMIISAFKEHNIGIVVGEETKGNGTNQEFISLNDFRVNKQETADLGALVFSSKKFYKLNGKSVQKNGIIPDIEFVKKSKENKDKNDKSEIDSDEVKAINFVPNNKNEYFKTAIKNSEQRLEKSENLKLYLKNNAVLSKNYLDLIKIRTLNLEKFITQLKEVNAKQEETLNPIFDKNIEFLMTPEGIKLIKVKEYLAAKRNKWLENLATDFQVDEGLNILEDVLFAK
jgi:carboxyl-terminal processing protease